MASTLQAESVAATSVQDLLAEFGERLQALRAGGLQDESSLLQTAQRLGAQGRPDAVSVARFYLDLPSKARSQGLHGEQAFFRIRADIQDAESLRGEDWREVRDEAQEDLLALIERHGAALD
ncbi:MAG: hypothetical protein JKY61_01250, partial [Planctomycetes bacterium]|nr:hypothetical protein [Planctomycetota bacterium]